MTGVKFDRLVEFGAIELAIMDACRESGLCVEKEENYVPEWMLKYYDRTELKSSTIYRFKSVFLPAGSISVFERDVVDSVRYHETFCYLPFERDRLINKICQNLNSSYKLE